MQSILHNWLRYHVCRLFHLEFMDITKLLGKKSNLNDYLLLDKTTLYGLMYVAPPIIKFRSFSHTHC